MKAEGAQVKGVAVVATLDGDYHVRLYRVCVQNIRATDGKLVGEELHSALWDCKRVTEPLDMPPEYISNMMRAAEHAVSILIDEHFMPSAVRQMSFK